MIWPAQTIMEFGPKIVSPYDEKNVNPASYDVTIAEEIFVRGNVATKLPLTFMPNEFIIASTIEYVKLPLNLAGDLKLKSTIGRKGINHALSGWIDPGFEGNITLELQNISGAPILLEPGIRIAQLVFMQLLADTQIPYSKTGRYQGQQGPTMARPERT